MPKVCIDPGHGGSDPGAMGVNGRAETERGHGSPGHLHFDQSKVRPMKNFFSRPYEFSFKDMLAVAFCGMFFYVAWRAIGNPDVLDLVKALIPLIMVILGGYFGQEMATAYFQRQNNPYGYYGGYYSPPYTPPVSGENGVQEGGGQSAGTI